ncbi:ABC-2 type transport system permease protein [Nocardia tenerifensis]|uniref:ABC-2 type transport system permease protein n=1 Tax=Nocardia tenerifensis TaxID=228006 RepID=A0A318JY81_9NOCA|nr:ABC transporter permease subunit [Nocardia tenerifensis]PXX59677.1 ABC-2 type transport system permease protein [Nocardia tenerifensis]
MLPEIYTRTVLDHRRATVAWAVGIAVVGLMYASFYPQVSEGGMADSVANYPEAMREALRLNDMSSAAGYLGSSVFGLLLPLLAMVYGVSFGARAIAGDEEAGYLDLLLAYPVSRVGLALQRFAALVTGAVAIGLVVFLGMLAIRSNAELDSISVGEFAAQCVNLVLLGITFGALAIGLGAATGRRGPVLAGAAGLGVLTYAAHSLAGIIGVSWLRYLSPFHYYIGGEPLRNGMQWGDAAMLAAISAALVIAGVTRFGRRDLNV